MNIFKRAYYYVTRKKSKSITVGVLLFVVATLVLTGFLIQKAADKTYEVAKEKLGSNVMYQTDTSTIIKNAMTTTTGERPDFSSITMPDDYTDLTTKEIETIVANSKYIKSYTYNLGYSANAIDFDYIEINTSTTAPEGTNAHIGLAMPELTVKNSSVSTDIANVGSIVSGAYFTNEQLKNGDLVVMIEQTLATLNDIKVGDTITVEKVERKMGEESTSVSIAYKVVGIYKATTTTDLSSSDFIQSSSMPENTLYVPTNSIFEIDYIGMTDVEKTAAKSLAVTDGYKVKSVTFVLNDSDDSDAFIAEVKAMKDINMTYRSLTLNDTAYEATVGNIENVASTAGILVIVVSFAGIAILMLLSILSLKDRKYEIGVLLSLGESKLKVTLQLISETLIIALLAFTIATVTSNFFSQTVTNYLLKQGVNSTSTTTTEDIRQGTGQGMGRGMGAFSPMNVDTSSLSADTIDKLTVSLDLASTLQTFGYGIIIIIIGNILQTIFIVRLNPKEIMLDR